MVECDWDQTFWMSSNEKEKEKISAELKRKKRNLGSQNMSQKINSKLMVCQQTAEPYNT